jgi:hypothetical protein
MTKTIVAVVALLLIPACAFAVDGVVLINHPAVIAAGGYPYRITQPGSYRLSGNLTVPAGVSGIEISTDNVTIDLNGFAITGAGMPAQVHGIVAGTDAPAQGYYNITIRNGTIERMGQDAIHLLGDNILVEYVRARNNLASGIVVRSPGNTLPGPGLNPQRSLILRHNTIGSHPSYGFKTFGGLITENTVTDCNTGIAVLAGGGVVTRNVVSDSSFGLVLAPSVSYFGNTLTDNTPTNVLGGVNLGQNLCTPAPCP